jgi:putative DNA primase/helicase
LIAELPGILVWALTGLRRLKARGHFVEPPECSAIKTRMLYLSDPVRGFVDECVTPDPSAATPKDQCYNAFKVYAERIGVKPPALHEFAERLYAILAGVTETRPRVAGRQVPHFGGMRLRAPETVSAPPPVDDEALMAFFEYDVEAVERLGISVKDALKRDVAGRPILRE